MTNSEQAIREIAEKTFPLDTEELYNSLQRLYRSELIERITVLISEHYVAKEDAGYPKEFVEWIGDDCSPCYLGREEDDYGKWVVFKKGSMEHEAEFDTLDELFNYWVNNKK